MCRVPLGFARLLLLAVALSACPEPARVPPTTSTPRAPALAATPSSEVPPAPTDDDGDGFAGTRDRCPAQSETWNDVDDQDGCPEDSPALVILEEGRLGWRAPLAFELGKPRLTPGSMPSIRASAALVGARRELRVVVAYRYRTQQECEGDQHRSSPLGRGRIRSTIEALVDAGIEREQVRPEGPGDYGPKARTLGPGISILVDDKDLEGPMSSHCEVAIGVSR